LPDDAELLMVDTACSSSLYAMDIGMKSLLLGTADVAVCGGSFALGPRGAVLFSKLHGLSTGGAVRSLDQAADGVLFSDGAGVVVLKRLRRALADGDQVLGLLAGLGASSDGKGKAIYAPSSAGQQLAVERALSAPGVDPHSVDWVVAHATGTPAGDLAEFTTLRSSMPRDHAVQVTSNKSLIGHTGWAAGVVSTIEVLLALRHGTIPRQHRFERAPTSFAIEEGTLQIPTAPVPWPSRPDRPRSASVSGFGFGGTNAHLVVQEFQGRGLALPHVRPEEPVVLVGWSSHLPGLGTPDDVRRWVLGADAGPVASFGESYPRPPFDKVRIPPGTLRTLDRCQLMILEAVFGLGEGLADFWRQHRDRTAVFAGHMGPTRNGTLYASRCYLDELERLMADAEPKAWRDGLSDVFGRYAARVRELVPRSNEDSFPGIMPNVIPARVANYLDFHGPNMTVDTGLSSTLSALAVAMRYLHAGDVDLAIVAGINGNSTPEAQATLTALAGGTAPLVAEGVVTLALVRESTARENGLSVIAHLEEVHGCPEGTSVGTESPWAGYLGAAGGFEVLKAALSGEPVTTVTSGDPDVPVAIRVRTAVRGTGTTVPLAKPVPAEPLRAEAMPAQPLPAEPLPAQLLQAGQVAPGTPSALRRHVIALQPAPLSPSAAPAEVLGEGTVVLTDNPSLAGQCDLPPGCLVLSTAHTAAPSSGVHVLDRVEPSTVAEALAPLRGQVRHVVVLTDLTSTTDPRDTAGADPSAALRLHDLLFLVAQTAHPVLAEGGSLVACLLGALPGGELHPFAGLYTGFVKCTAIEMPESFSLALATSTRDPQVALRQAVAEAGAEQQLPVVVYDGDLRKTLTAFEEDAPLHDGAVGRLGRESVVLAVGGSRGITSTLLEQLARRHQPVIYVVGTTDPIRSGELPARPDYVREQRAADPSRSVAEVNREYDRMANAAVVRDNLARLEQLSGAGRVHYLRADVRDADAVAAAVGTVLRDAGRIDLLLDTAGINKSAEIPRKGFEDFRAVRDVKVVGYQNLKRALGDHAPGMWCSFSSFVGFTGQSGEVDYAAGNDFLGTAAEYANRVLGADEFAIGWSLWASVGLGADPVKRTFLEKGGMYTRMSTEEGVHHFLREVHLPTHQPSVVLMGDAEKSALLDYRPSFPIRSAAARSGEFFVDSVTPLTPGSVEVERTFDLSRDAYLAEHSVYGHATLPGTFVTELAAEAARVLEPGRHAVTFENLQFVKFLRVYDATRPVRKKVRATVMSRSAQETVVDVQVLTDVVSPGGVVLQRDKPHFSLVVRMREEFPDAPTWDHWSAAEDGPATPDPYHLENPAVLLTGAFVSTRGTRQHALGRRAEYDLHVAAGDRRFSQFLVPALLLDGLVRVSVLTPVDDGYLTLAAPASMRRIDLYQPANDLQLAAAYPTLSLYSSPRGIDLEDPTCGNRCVAVAPDGHVVTQIHDTTTALLGYVHPDTGHFRSVDEMAAIRRERALQRVSLL
ncbi:MAG TPA: SDR family NAD(P)-dependent oxidoreductase, partial [Actinomycetales bacterium]|nr:SDR family NAD(P)-dependent oxidoreductase [Actinomycetales bacterium]